MKFSRLQISNFRSHVSTDIPLDRLTLVAGPNHSGKSTIRLAMEYALAGRNQLTTDDGKGAAELLCDPKTHARVKLEMGENCFLAATITEKGSRQAGVHHATDMTEAMRLQEQFRRDRDIISCLCDTGYFLRLHHSRQKALLASLIFPEEFAVDPAIKNDYDTAGIGGTGVWALPPIQMFDKVYELATAKRTLVNRDLKQFQMPTLPDDGEPPTHTVLDVQIRIEKLNAERTALSFQSSVLVRDYDRAVLAWQDWSNTRTILEKKVESERLALDTVKSVLLSNAQVKELENVSANKSKATQLETEINDLVSKIVLSTERANAIGALGPKCPTCNQDIAAESIELTVNALGAQCGPWITRKAEAVKERKLLGDPDGARAKLDVHERHRENAKIVEAHSREARETLSQHLEKEPHKPTERPDTSALEEKIDTIIQLINHGSSILLKIGVWDRANAEIAKAKERHKALQMEAQRIEKVCIYFGPEGVKPKIIAQHIAPFTSEMKKIMEAWGYDVDLTLEPEYGFVVTQIHDGGTITLPVQALSASEQYRFSIAFQVAIAILSGYKFIVADGADILDQASLKALYRVLFRTRELDQAIVLTTGVSEPNAAPGSIWIAAAEIAGETKVQVVRHNEDVIA